MATSTRKGRVAGQANTPALDKIRKHRNKLEKMLLDKALAGDVEAIQACLELLDKESSVTAVSSSLRERVNAAGGAKE